MSGSLADLVCCTGEASGSQALDPPTWKRWVCEVIVYMQVRQGNKHTYILLFCLEPPYIPPPGPSLGPSCLDSESETSTQEVFLQRTQTTRSAPTSTQGQRLGAKDSRSTIIPGYTSPSQPSASPSPPYDVISRISLLES